MDLSSIALQGLEQAQTLAEAAGAKLSSVGAPSAGGASLDTVAPSTDMIALMTAQNDTAINVSLLKTAEEAQKSVVDLIA